MSAPQPAALSHLAGGSDRGGSAYVFDGPIRDAVHRLKYGSEHARAHAGRTGLAQLLTNSAGDQH